jgi:hypothetical protein
VPDVVNPGMTTPSALVGFTGRKRGEGSRPWPHCIARLHLHSCPRCVGGAAGLVNRRRVLKAQSDGGQDKPVFKAG